MRISRGCAAVVLAVVMFGATTGCAVTSPSTEFAPSAGPAIGDDAPETSPSASNGDDTAGDQADADADADADAGAEEAEAAAPAAAWTEEELLGACKEAVNSGGAAISWDGYESDPSVAQAGDAWTVTIAAISAGDPIECAITGTPQAPEVDVR